MTRETRRHFKPGTLHAGTTLAQMRANVRLALGEPIVWETARAIVANVTVRDQAAQARAIRAWVAARFRYVNDPTTVELLASPGMLLKSIDRAGYVQGDCDDAATLTAALLSAIGIPCELWAVGFKADAPFGHVFTVAAPRGGAPYEMDVTRPAGVALPRQFPRRLRARI